MKKIRSFLIAFALIAISWNATWASAPPDPGLDKTTLSSSPSYVLIHDAATDEGQAYRQILSVKPDTQTPADVGWSSRSYTYTEYPVFSFVTTPKQYVEIPDVSCRSPRNLYKEASSPENTSDSRLTSLSQRSPEDPPRRE